MVGDIIIGCGGVYLLIGLVLMVALARAAGKIEPAPTSEEEGE